VPLLVIAPVLGIPIVPVTLVVGVGLTPSELSSVASSGIPVGPIPSGVVAPSEGTAVSGSSIWAHAGLQHNNGKPSAAIQMYFIEVSLT
jgi:hypothetical protein